MKYFGNGMASMDLEWLRSAKEKHGGDLTGIAKERLGFESRGHEANRKGIA